MKAEQARGFVAGAALVFLILFAAPSNAVVRTTYLYHDIVPNICVGATQFCTSPNFIDVWASNDARGYPILVGATWPHTGYDTASTFVKYSTNNIVGTRYYLLVETFVAANANNHSDNVYWEVSWVGRFG